MTTGQTHEDLGLNLAVGSQHYRAFIGPSQDYDLVSAMSFGLLTTLGLRQHHSLLDIGCGSLRLGRLLIPYLNKGNYVGIEPNEWLVKEGIAREVGEDQIRIKEPRLLYADSAADLDDGEVFDFAVAQSIFSHCGRDLVERWLVDVSGHLSHSGALVATFIGGAVDFVGSGWVYPHCVSFRLETMMMMSVNAGLRFRLLDWRHPRQQWALFAAPGFEDAWLAEKVPSWNTAVDSGVWNSRLPADPLSGLGIRPSVEGEESSSGPATRV